MPGIPIRESAVTTALAALLVVSVSACGAGDGADDSGSTNELRIDQRANVVSIDPIQAAALVDVQVIGLVHGRLFEFAQDSATETEPSLAQGIESSEDGTQFVISLEPDLTFSDGSPLTSADVVSSLTRARDTPGVYQADVAILETITATDESTVTIGTARPVADLTEVLALPALSVLPAAVAGTDDYYGGTDVVFSGQYVPDGDWSSNGFALERNEESSGPQPTFDRIDVTVVSDGVTSMTRLRGGETDFAQNLPLEAETQLGGDLTWATDTTLGSLFIVPNNQGGLFSDVRIRQAMAWAIDRAALAEVMYGTDSTVNAGPFHSAADFPQPVEAYGEQDVDRARELLQGTACEDGCTFSLTHFASSEPEGRAAQVLKQQLAPLGMEAEVVPVEDTQFVEDALAGTFDASIVESGAFNLPGTLTGAFDPATYGCVSAGCQDDSASQLIADLLAATDDAAAEAASRSFTELFQEWTPIIPIADAVTPHGVRTDLQDLITVQPNNVYRIAPRD